MDPRNPVSAMLGYLINQYPMPSQTFIRREIAALEALGTPVRRYSLRRESVDLVDPEDRAEAQRTNPVLAVGATGLLVALAATAGSRPLRFLRALAAAWRLGGRSHRGRLMHLVYLAEACVLRRWLARDGIHHLHAHFGTNSTTVAMLCHLLGGPRFSFTAHGPEEFDQPFALSLGEKVAHAAFAVAISSFGRSQLMRWAPHDLWSKVHVVHCGVDPVYLQAKPLPIPATPVAKLVNIGRLAEQKGQLLLVEAAARLRSTGRAFEIVVIGDGELRPQLEARIAALRLHDHVKLVGWQNGEQVRAHLTQARGLVLPSFAEGLPVVIMEALALQRPVVTTQIAGIPELVRPGETGWLVPAGDVEALTNALGDLVDAPVKTLERMGALGASLVAREHDVRVEAKKLAALFAAQ